MSMDDTTGTIELLAATSPDHASRDVKAVLDLFPEARGEDGQVDLEELRDVLGRYVNDDAEAYGFTWPGRFDAIRQSQTPSGATLLPLESKSEQWDTTGNLYVEGDNLEVLKLLQTSYGGKVDMVYIDPPYNTGSDFVYRDSFGDTLENYKEQTGQANSANPETAGRYHSNWASMMLPRLRVARKLLSEKGVIFVSIDDHESATLCEIGDQVFGEDCFMGDIAWQKTYSPRNDANGIPPEVEHILAWSRNPHWVPRGGASVTNYWSHAQAGHNDAAKKEIKRLFDGHAPFDTPKPTKLVRRILDIATDKDSLVMDFFSGSATTAQAVMRANLADGGRRRWILVQIPEQTSGSYGTLCDIGEERIRRAAAEIRKDTAGDRQQPSLDVTEHVPDTGFRVFALDSSNMLVQHIGTETISTKKADRSELDVLFEAMLRWGLDLSLPIHARQCDGYGYYEAGDGVLAYCGDDGLTPAILERIVETTRPRRVLLRLNVLMDNTALTDGMVLSIAGKDVEVRVI